LSVISSIGFIYHLPVVAIKKSAHQAELNRQPRRSDRRRLRGAC
jgi:hypothetical protein